MSAATKTGKAPVPPWRPPVPDGDGYQLEDDGWLVVLAGIARPDPANWVPLRQWRSGQLLCWPALKPGRPAGPCRWALECTAAAVVTIPHGQFGNIDACAQHADDYREGSTPLGSLMEREADPECWCPDHPTRPDRRLRVKYCPSHGTGPQRGIDQLADRKGPLYR